MKTILFVCTGNTCRSSMAEGLIKNALASDPKQIKDIQVVSAGISAVPGQKASPQAIYVMKELGIDISEHKSKRLTKNLVNTSSLILTMTKAHKQMLLKKYPQAKDKVFTLKEYVNMGNSGIQQKNTSSKQKTDQLKDTDIRDPFGQSVEIYRQCALELKDNIDKLLKKIKNQ